ncbi:aldo/keto reductase [Priestia taiwanensis]|uniref:Glyoxal reductase n=1 Tax=Priestia taiwanensis TaxID=1347902 RepID=A0A917ASQ1_9BACI|nr:aldo/keto reductase [Priestia taiwanensis]MBM7363081.1 diketogulonate reductase-like aldo/keto reductase [Priestia taiwanensis]GGE67551.1 glyoxal reductase [Priestia taiwanensis]
MNITSTTTLYNGIKMPILGLGVYKAQEGNEVKNAIKTALQLGYRSIDTASLYGNEQGVGEAIRESGIPREELFITTKIWNTDHGYTSTIDAFYESLKKLGLSYIDLYLIHWPVQEKFLDTYRAMEKLYEEGLVRAIGVCNFHTHHLEKLLANCTVKPVINQIEMHPRLSQVDVRHFCTEQDIQVEAWSPLMRGGEVLQNDIVQTLATKYNKTPAQIVLRWHLQHDVIIIPKSVTPARIKENSEIFDFALTDEDMLLIDSLHTNTRTGKDPDTFHLYF